jgi:hypothetical protein
MNHTGKRNWQQPAPFDLADVLSEQERRPNPVGFSTIFDELAGGAAYVLLLIGAFLALHLAPAHAGEGVRLEVLGGQCKLTASGPGVWHNPHYPNTFDLSAGCMQIGLSEILSRKGPWAFGFRLAYVDLGTVKWMATYPMRDDEQFTLKPDGTNCVLGTRESFGTSGSPNWMRGCVGRGEHQQSHKGVSLGYLAEREFSLATLGVDVGGFLYYGHFRYTVQSWPDGSFFGPWHDNTSVKGWQLTPYLGVTVRHGPFLLQVRGYGSIKAARSGCGDCSGVSAGPGWQLVGGLSLPF